MSKILSIRKLFLMGAMISLINLLLPASSYAYIYNGFKWPTNAIAVDFGSPTIPSSWITPIANGLNPWNATASPFTFSASVSNNDITVSNLGGMGPLARTTVSFSGSVISDCDLAFNNTYSWSTSGAAGLYDVQNVATHEFGHFLSLGDLTGGGNTEKTMYLPTATGETKKRTLDTDDINGINFIYP